MELDSWLVFDNFIIVFTLLCIAAVQVASFVSVFLERLFYVFLGRIAAPNDLRLQSLSPVLHSLKIVETALTHLQFWANFWPKWITHKPTQATKIWLPDIIQPITINMQRQITLR